MKKSYFNLMAKTKTGQWEMTFGDHNINEVMQEMEDQKYSNKYQDDEIKYKEFQIIYSYDNQTPVGNSDGSISIIFTKDLKKHKEIKL